MSLTFFMIDFENVQLKNIGLLTPGACRIKVFLGQNQAKLLLELVQALQRFGTDAEYIQIVGSGPNALDFHIAFYIGRLASLHPDASFTIISGDTGFDPLVKHLASLNIQCKRLAVIPGASKVATPVAAKTSTVAKVSTAVATPAKKATAAAPAKSKLAKSVTFTFLPEPSNEPAVVKTTATTTARVAEVIARLKGLKAAKPAKLATLQSSIKSWFKPALPAKELASVIDALTSSNKIKVVGTKVTYALG